MQKSLYCLFFVLATTCIFGQSKPHKTTVADNRRIDTYYYHKSLYDSVRFTIQNGKDTILKETLWRNGHYQTQTWGNDSLFEFNAQGLIESKYFGLHPKNKVDSTIEFYSNGQIRSLKVWKEGILFRNKEFNEDGYLTEKMNKIKIGKYGLYRIEHDSSGLLHTSFTDTLFVDNKPIEWVYDTVFYRNGQPFFICIRKDKDLFLKRDFYDKQGRITESIVTDSLYLRPFKDNVDCYYGLKNGKGDTIYKPRFDRIETLDNNRYAVYEGTKCRLMRADGSFVATPEMNSISKTNNKVLLLKDFDNKAQWRKARDLYKFNISPLLVFGIGKNEGVIDRHGQIVCPPSQRNPSDQYRSIKINNNAGFNDTLFEFYVDSKDTSTEYISTHSEEGYLKPDGQSLFPNYIYVKQIDNCPHYQVSHSLKAFSYDRFNVYGLINHKGEELLPCQFVGINRIGSTDLFRVYTIEGERYSKQKGIFDVQNKRWIIDTLGALTIDNDDDNFFIVKVEKTKKYGVMNTKGKYIVPAVYDSLIIANKEQQLLIGRKGKTYQFVSLTKKRSYQTYDFLVTIPFKYEFSHEDLVKIPVYLAKRNGKWGIVDSNDHVLKPFTADYAAYTNINYLENNVLLVENKVVHSFTDKSFPNEGFFVLEYGEEKTGLTSFKLADNPNRVFFFNDDNKIVIPPQYNSIESESYFYNIGLLDYYLVEDEQKKRKLIDAETGETTDFPFDYQILHGSKGSKILIVSDDKLVRQNNSYPMNMGVVSKDGRILTPCTNSAIALADEKTSSYFVKRDTPTVPFYSFLLRNNNFDTLNAADNNWFWYNAEGQLLDSTAFRYPIDFSKGLGIGMKGELFGLYNLDGRVIASPQYGNIRQDKKTGFYYLFENQGLTTTVRILNREGQPLVERGRYDAVSSFYGKYALVSSAEKIGLIDTTGKEILALQDLRTFNSGNLLDSIGLKNKELEEQEKKATDYGQRNLIRVQKQFLPINFKDRKVNESIQNPDSLSLSAPLRNALSQLILDKIQKEALWRIYDTKISRAKQHAVIYYVSRRDCFSDMQSEEEQHHYYGLGASATPKTLSFILNRAGGLYRFVSTFHNFYQKNNRWEEITINDLLNLQGDKRWAFNDLLIQKVKALKDVDIDCSNTSAFIEQVEDSFMLTKDGVDFCFSSKDNDDRFVVVSFSWAELEGYLKMRF